MPGAVRDQNGLEVSRNMADTEILLGIGNVNGHTKLSTRRHPVYRIGRTRDSTPGWARPNQTSVEETDGQKEKVCGRNPS